ncbi:MAG TPA: lysylphosphatidylglycerol synthase transmembrane domain-containing protein [Sulfuriferula sp.]|nr:lysylphosphatidylglycerol synthase transmembrane domain-containing protein [Sulfuriferula sp.]
MRRSLWLVALGLILGLSIPLLYGGSGLFQRLAAFPLSLLGVVLTMIFIGWNFNAGRMRLMLGGIGQPMTHARALATVMATEFAFCATPAGSGGPLTYVFLLRRHGVPGTGAAALYALDVLMDMLFFTTALLVIALTLLLQPEQLQAGWQLALLAGLLVGAMALAWVAARHYRSTLLWTCKRLRKWQVSAATRRRVVRMLLRFRQGLRLTLGLSRGRLLAVYALCVGHWLMRYSILYVLIAGLGRHISWAYSFLIQMLALTAGQFTLLPGGSGGVELSFTALLAPVLDHATLGAVLLMWRFTTYYWYLIAGAPVFALFAGKALWQLLGNGAPKKAGAAQATSTLP